MRVLVTGGSGFIGSHVVDKLSDAGHDPKIFDARPSAWHPKAPVALGSITDVDALAAASADCDAIIHLAAVADVGHVLADPDTAETVNSRGTLAVLEAARRSGVHRVVYGSTIWVYSDCPEVQVDEDSRLAPPAHLYSATKLAGELYLRSYAELYGVDYTVLRFGIPYGPRARPAAVVPAFVEKALRGEPLTVAGDGAQGRRFVYVEDLADGIVRGLAPEAANRVYNLAGQETTTIKEIAQTVVELVGGSTEIVFTPGRAGDFGGKEVCSARAADELGWRPSTPFREGVTRYVAWRRERDEVDPGPPAPAAATRPERVLILSADIGEGHDGPARALARELAEEAPEAEVEVRDGLAAMGRLMTRVVRDGSWTLFRHARPLFALQYWLFMRIAPTRWFARRVLYLMGGRRLRKLVRSWNADAVISTYPGVTEVLGELRRRGRLDVPCYSAITDLAALNYWAHPAIDLHFVTHPESVEEVDSIAGPGRVRWSRPPSSADFLEPRDQADARAALGLPSEGKVVTVSGGGWGIGDLCGAVRVALGAPEVHVVALAGRNEEAHAALAAAFGNDSRVEVWGFTEKMSDLLAASDALVHSTAGLTVLEAIIRGCPVISYGFSVGHVELNNQALTRFGLARVARTPAELRAALAGALAERPAPDPSFVQRRSSAGFVLDGVPPRRGAEVAPSARRLLRPVATRALGVLAAVAVTFGVDIPYHMVSGALGIKPVTSVRTSARQVGLMVDVPAAQIPGVAQELARHDVHASFETTGTLPAATLRVLRVHGDDAVPRIKGGALTRWLGTRHDLGRRRRRLGLTHHFVYAVPKDGFTLGQYVLARTMGARAVSPSVRLDAGTPPRDLHQGVVLELRSADGSELRRIVADLRRGGITAVPVTELVGDDS